VAQQRVMSADRFAAIYPELVHGPALAFSGAASELARGL